MLFLAWLLYSDSTNSLTLKRRYNEVKEWLCKVSDINKTGDKKYVAEKVEILKHNIII